MDKTMEECYNEAWAIIKRTHGEAVVERSYTIDAALLVSAAMMACRMYTAPGQCDTGPTREES